MNLSVAANYEEMSVQAAELIIASVNQKPDSLLCFAAGDTPLSTFSCLVEAARNGLVSFERCRFVSLDEWIGLNGSMQGSCKQTLSDHLFSPLSIQDENICFFDGTSEDLQSECSRMDSFIAANGPIDILLLGIGMNGHLGFNEPGVNSNLYSHVIDLDEITRSVSSKYFHDEMQLTQGITLGIKHIMKSGMVILIANGMKKAGIIEMAFQRKATNAIPASILQLHQNFYLLLDELAASKIN